jgi:hypothetical protein
MLVREDVRVLLVVTHEYERDAAFVRPLPHELRPKRTLQCRKGLVEQQEPRRRQNRSTERDSLTLPA